MPKYFVYNPWEVYYYTLGKIYHDVANRHICIHKIFEACVDEISRILFSVKTVWDGEKVVGWEVPINGEKLLLQHIDNMKAIFGDIADLREYIEKMRKRRRRGFEPYFPGHVVQNFLQALSYIDVKLENIVKSGREHIKDANDFIEMNYK